MEHKEVCKVFLVGRFFIVEHTNEDDEENLGELSGLVSH